MVTIQCVIEPNLHMYIQIIGSNYCIIIHLSIYKLQQVYHIYVNANGPLPVIQL